MMLLFGLGAIVRGYIIRDPNAVWDPLFVVGAGALIVFGVWLLYTGQKEGKE